VTAAPELALGARFVGPSLDTSHYSQVAPASRRSAAEVLADPVTMLGSLTLTNRGDSWGATMRAVVRWLMKHVVLLSLLTAPAAGCSAERDDSTADATTSSSIATEGPIAFVAQARATTFGRKDFAAASDGGAVAAREGRVRRAGHRGPGFPSGRPATGAVGGTPDDHRSHGVRQERGAPPLPTACQRHPLTWRRYMPGPRGPAARGGQRAPAVTTGSKESQVSPEAQPRQAPP
jgi:hypothetical protein